MSLHLSDCFPTAKPRPWRRCCIHCIALLSLEHNLTSFQRFVDLTLPKLLFDLFYSEQIDKSSGEAVVLFFANILHSGLAWKCTCVLPMRIFTFFWWSNGVTKSQTPHQSLACFVGLLNYVFSRKHCRYIRLCTNPRHHAQTAGAEGWLRAPPRFEANPSADHEGRRHRASAGTETTDRAARCRWDGRLVRSARSVSEAK